MLATVQQGCPDVPEERAKPLVPTNSKEPNIGVDQNFV